MSKVEKRLRAVAGRYKGAIYTAGNRPVAATDGHCFVILGHTDLFEALRALERWTAEPGAPDLASTRGVLRAAGPFGAGVAIDAGTLPDAELRAQAVAELEGKVRERAAFLEAARAELARREAGPEAPPLDKIAPKSWEAHTWRRASHEVESARAHLASLEALGDTAVGIKGRLRDARSRLRLAERALPRAERDLLKRHEKDHGVAAGAKAVREAEREHKAAERELRVLDTPHARAVRVGEAAFDLRLVRRALRALGATSGTLAAGPGAFDPGLLTTDTGVALVMPFRQ